jgi:hypothetical protein
MSSERSCKMRKNWKVIFKIIIDAKKEKKSVNFLMLHNLDPNINKKDATEKPGKRKIKNFKEDE